MAGADALPLPVGLPASLRSVATSLEQIVDRAASTLIWQEGPTSSVIAATWTGEAAAARRAEATTLRARIRRAGGKLRDMSLPYRTYADTLEEAIENVTRWQAEWDEAERTYRSRVRALNNEPDDEGLDKQAIADRWADERDVEHRRLCALYEAEMEDLRVAGKSAATTIQGLCDDVVPQSKAGSRLEIGAYLLRGMELAGGEAMVEYAESVRERFEADLAAATAGTDATALTDFVNDYGDYVENPHFAYVIARDLGADGLMKAFTDLSLSNIAYAGNDGLAEQQAVMGVLGTLYVTASGAADGGLEEGGYAAEEITQWRTGWHDSLIESGRSRHSFENEGMAAGSYYGYYAQGLMLTAAAQNGVVPDEAYMHTVGVDLVEWDRSLGDGREWDFAVESMHKPRLITDDGALGVQAEDPVWALLNAAAKDEASTYALLNEDIGSGSDTRSVVSYLVEERGALMGNRRPFLDGGALLADTVAAHGSDRTDEQSVALAANYLHSYLETVGTGMFDIDGDDEGDVEISEYAFAQARTGTADLISAHVEDFIRATAKADRGDTPYSSVSTPGEPVTWQLNFNQGLRDTFANVFGDLALDRPEELVTADNPGAKDNPPALQRVFNAALAHNATALHEAFATLPDGDPDAVMNDGAGFLVYLTENAGHGRIESAEAEDAYGAYLKKVLDAGAGLVPVGSIPVVGGLADAGYGLATDAILDQLVDTEHTSRQQTIEADLGQTVRELLQEQATMAVVEAGAWEEGKDPVTWATKHGLSPEQNFIRDGQLMPLEEILEAPAKEDAFFNHYLRAQDGAAGVLLNLEDQVQQAVSYGKDTAEDDHTAGDE